MSGISGLPTSLVLQHMLARNGGDVNSSLMKLATGLRINSGKDDPAGLISSEALRSELKQLESESRALARAKSVSSVADAAMGEVSDLLVEAEALAVASANTGGLSEAEIEANQMQMDSIVQSVQRIADSTEFNGEKLLDGSFSVSVGEETVNVSGLRPSDLGETEIDGETYRLSDMLSGGSIDLADGDLSKALDVLDEAQSQVANQRGELGAFERNIIDPSIRSNNEAFVNVAESESIIRDTDYAFETARLARSQTLYDANVLTAAVNKQNTAAILNLLGGNS